METRSIKIKNVVQPVALAVNEICAAAAGTAIPREDKLLINYLIAQYPEGRSVQSSGD